jgi:trigger factor
MNVTFDKKDALNGTISVQIASTDYMPDYDKKLKDYRKKTNIPGFRPGTAPMGMIEKQIGNSVLLEAINGLASKGLYDYINDNKVNLLGEPVLNQDTLIEKIEKGIDYNFKFDLGLAPEFDLNIGKDDVFTRYSVSVDDAEVTEEIGRMRKRFGKLEEVSVAEQDNDMVYLNLVELADDKTELEGGVKADNVPMLLSAMNNAEAKALLTGISKGATSTVNIFTLFNNDEQEMSHALGVAKVGVADLNPNFSFEVVDIKRNIEGEVNQELFDAAYGPGNITTEADLRARISEDIKGFYVSQADHLLEHNMMDTLVAKHNVTLPDEFLKRWLMDRYADKFTTENIETAYLPEANYLRNHLVEEKIMAANEIKIEEADIRAAAIEYTKQMFGGYSMSGLNEDLLNQLIEPSLKKEDYRSKMINSAVKIKVNAAVKSMITIEEKLVSKDEFMNIVEAHNHAQNSNQYN